MLEKVKSLPEGPIFLKIFNASEETTEDDVRNFYKDFKIMNIYPSRNAPEFELKCEDKASAIGIIEKGPGVRYIYCNLFTIYDNCSLSKEADSF